MRQVTLMSDVHLEFGMLNLQKGGQDLILAGDICVVKHLLDINYQDLAARYTNFFDRCNRLFDRVIYVPGNHEYYGYEIERAEEALRGYFDHNHFHKIFVLQNGTLEVGDTVYVGTTLWSDMDKNSPQTIMSCQRGVSDFYESFYKGRAFRAEDVPGLHDYAHGFIRRVCHDHQDKELVVVTHMAPTYQSIHPRYAGNPLNGFFASDLSETILENPNIRYWVHGHVHSDFDYMVGDCRVMCNPRGYVRYEARADNYNMEFQFEIKG